VAGGKTGAKGADRGARRGELGWMTQDLGDLSFIGEARKQR
jgi:hypothetical protein